MPKFFVEIDNGEGGDTIISASSIADAAAWARKWAEDGEWKREGTASVSLRAGTSRESPVLSVEEVAIGPAEEPDDEEASEA